MIPWPHPHRRTGHDSSTPGPDFFGALFVTAVALPAQSGREACADAARALVRQQTSWDESRYGAMTDTLRWRALDGTRRDLPVRRLARPRLRSQSRAMGQRRRHHHRARRAHQGAPRHGPPGRRLHQLRGPLPLRLHERLPPRRALSRLQLQRPRRPLLAQVAGQLGRPQPRHDHRLQDLGLGRRRGRRTAHRGAGLRPPGQRLHLLPRQRAGRLPERLPQRRALPRLHLRTPAIAPATSRTGPTRVNRTAGW